MILVKDSDLKFYFWVYVLSVHYSLHIKLYFGFYSLGIEKTLFIVVINIHCVFSISEHNFLDSEDLSLFAFISESNVSYFYVYLCALN